MDVLKVAFLKFGLKGLYPVKSYPAVFTPRGLLDELLNRCSNTGLGSPIDFIPRSLSSCSFYYPDSSIPPQYPALKTTAP